MGLSNLITTELKKTGIESIDNANYSLNKKLIQSMTVKSKSQLRENSNEKKPVTIFKPLEGVLIESIEILNTGTTINHGLERPLVGYLVINIDTATTIFNSTPTNDSNFDYANTFKLTSGASCKVSLWVF